VKKLGLNELRKTYLDFFEQKGHLVLQSASLVPQNDKSLLLTAAGMAPLKPYFTGQEIPPNPRMVSCQKCVRTNDIENVGVTSRHCTMFEMLGNFSIGDYFKEEAIEWAWEFVTKVLEIPENLLYPSVYLEDDEAYNIWRDKIGISPERIVKLGKADNFWELAVGPCGPCSEIYFDRGEGSAECNNENCYPGCECDRYVEIWNLVFTQFNRNEDGTYSPLEQKNIDTGMGLERTASALQGVASNFDIDTFKAIRDAVCAENNIQYGATVAINKSVRIITDHTRAVMFMLSDGIMPSNESRGYVLRKLLRRAALHGKLLGIAPGFLTRITEVAMQQSEGAYPNLRERADFIFKMIETEEQRFNERLDAGVDVLKKFLSSGKTFTGKELGEQAFIMYDTFGFPAEMTQELLVTEGIDVEIDMDVFESEMEKQRNRARGAREDSSFTGGEDSPLTRLPADIATEFAGYNNKSIDAKILAVIHDGEDVIIVPDKTVLYAEGGGQKGDSGFIRTETGEAEIHDCKRSGNKSAHIGKIIKGEIKTGQQAKITFNKTKRDDTARNHTATHILHRALKDVLGSHVEQSGSMVDQNRLRFDFTHFQPLTTEELLKIEDIVNNTAISGLLVETKIKTPDEAREMGAVALFDEKYGDKVNVVCIGDYSMELCGGTHVENTGQIGAFEILSESGIAAGIRRIEAITGIKYLNFKRDAKTEIHSKIQAHIKEINDLKKEITKLKKGSATNLADDLLKNKETINGITVISGEIVTETDTDSRRELADNLRFKLSKEPGLILLLFKNEDGGSTFLAAATDSAVKQGVHCGNIIKETVKQYNGRGGGKPDMAQGGIPAGVSAGEVFRNVARFS